MKTIILSCTECKKEFSVGILDREFYFCPYCGKKAFTSHNETAGIRHRIKQAKSPLEKWHVAEDLYEICKEKDILYNDAEQKEFAKYLDISHALLYTYIKAVAFANREGIDKKRLRVSNAYELSRAADYDLVCDILKSSYGKDIYTATQKEIREIINDLKDVHKDGIFGEGFFIY